MTNGDPVSLYDGHLEHTFADMNVNGLFPITITRRYESNSSYDSVLGYGWSFGHDQRLYQYPDGSVIIRYACGSRDRFVYTGGAYVTPNSGRQGELLENPDGSFVYTHRYGIREFYDAQGRLTAVQNKYGHRHEYSYDPGGKYPLTGTSPYAVDPSVPLTVAYVYRVTRIDERAADGVLTGNYVTFAYNATTGRVASVTSGDGRTVSYVHDTTGGLTAGNLVQVNGLEGITTTYQYTDPNDSHNLTYILEEAGVAPLVNTYDSQDRVIAQTHGVETFSFTYVVDLTETLYTQTIRDAAGQNPYDVDTRYFFDASGELERIRDAEGNEIEFLRDVQGSLTSKKFYENQGTVAEPTLVLQRTINMTYEALGRETSESVTLDSGETITTSRTWDNGWLSSTETVSSLTPSKLFRTEYTFYRDVQNVPTNIQSIKRRKDDGSFQATSFVYDAKNRLSQTILPDGQKIISLYEAGSLYVTKQYYEVAAAESPFGRLRYGYDAQGNRNQMWDANDNLTQYGYDERGRLIATTNALGEQSILTYTGSRLTQTETGYTTADGEGQMTRLNYTPEGWLESIDEKDDQGAWQRVLINTHDSAGQTLTAADAQNRTVSYLYDLLGNKVSVSDPLSKTTTYGYDIFGNRISVIDANNNETRTVFDDMDRVIQVEQLGVTPSAVTAFNYDAVGNLQTVTDAENHTTNYTVDTLSRVTSITQPLGQTLQKVYDSRDRLDYMVNARGHKIDYGHEAWDVVSRVEHYNTVSAQSPDRTINYAYDNALNLTSVTDDSIPVGPLYTYTYDALNRADVTTIGYIPGGNRTLDYDYDRFGNITGILLTDGMVLTHTYNYDKRNRLASAVLPGNQSFSFIYYPSGELQQTTYPNGVITDYVYEANGPIQSITLTDSSSTIAQFSYTYDSVRNVDTKTDYNGHHDYGYDGLYRLSQAVYPAQVGIPVENYTYDDVGNREDPSDGAQYDYDINNRITQSPGLTYNYDADGNQTGRSDGVSMIYDKNNRMVQFSSDATNAIYHYDPMGRRIGKVVNGAAVWFLWDGNNLMAEFNNIGSIVKRYAFLPGETQPSQVEDSVATYNVHEDHLQTPRLLTNESQKVVWRLLHKSFGLSSVEQDPDGDAFDVAYNVRLKGQYEDEETGFHYNYMRYYDVNTGRYLNSDPIGMAGGINQYKYAYGNPINASDPFGLFSADLTLSKVRKFTAKGLNNSAAFWRELNNLNNAILVKGFGNSAAFWRELNNLNNAILVKGFGNSAAFWREIDNLNNAMHVSVSGDISKLLCNVARYAKSVYSNASEWMWELQKDYLAEKIESHSPEKQFRQSPDKLFRGRGGGGGYGFGGPTNGCLANTKTKPGLCYSIKM